MFMKFSSTASVATPPSSMNSLTNSRSLNRLAAFRMKMDGAFFNPIDMKRHWNEPNGVTIAVRSWCGS